ncbi:hypothetical protein LMF32_02365 [Desemzia sp. C1]|uniref:type IV toxin-antitoxin system AbiEi family antitoxin domain-containing protein n=1 Tax=Desemzia sp. C1 TaxID=2892016 RepID=UPI001E359C1F|nr:hypothetical protein [Desemzia sp. C1]MCI3027974.1 hypothetical protein [Desemzia sp. C1]
MKEQFLNFYHFEETMSKKEKIDTIVSILDMMDSSEVDDYLQNIRKKYHLIQLSKYIPNRALPEYDSKEFQFLILLHKYNGVVIRKIFRAEGFSDYLIKKLSKMYQLDEVDNGIYIFPDSSLDQEFILQNKFSKAVISHETALYHHDLTDVIPKKIYISLPKNYNLSQIYKTHHSDSSLLEGIEFSNNNPIMKKDKTEMLSMNNNPIIVTSAERTIADVLKRGHRTEIEIIEQAIIRYLNNANSRLIRLRRVSKEQNTLVELDKMIDTLRIKGAVPNE